jgi:hypothetical protein
VVRLRKEDTADLDVDELDSIEYSTETFDTYDGEVPPKDLNLGGYVRKMWWTRSANNDPMLKILWVAEENDGDAEEFNGCPFWLNYALIGSSKFRWAPFLETYGLTLKQVKNNIDVADKDDSNGAPINKIGSWKPGEENDEAWCRIITGSERYNGAWKPAIASWLPYDAEDEDAEPDDDNETDDEYDEEDEDDAEPEPEPEPEPARGRGRAAARSAPAKPAATRGGRTTRAAAPAPDKPAPARGARGTRVAPAAKTAAKGTAPRGRTRGRNADDEPPF